MQPLFSLPSSSRSSNAKIILPQSRRSGAFADGTGYWWLLQQSRGLLHPTGDDVAAVPCMASKGIPKATEIFRGLTKAPSPLKKKKKKSLFRVMSLTKVSTFHPE